MGAFAVKAQCRFKLSEVSNSNLNKVLSPELNDPSERIRVQVEQDQDCLLLTIHSTDITGLRAALNSYLRMIECANKVLDLKK